jgi:hypothetical protein
MMMWILIAGMLATGAPMQAAPAAAVDLLARDACDLLTTEEIGSLQAVGITKRKASGETRGAVRIDQCFFTAADFTRSVSLTRITGDAAGYWRRTFGPAGAAASPSRKKDPPRAVAGVGREAFWTSDARTGALYVLDEDVVLRISVGGVPDETERLRRTQALARAAIRRLR